MNNISLFSAPFRPLFLLASLAAVFLPMLYVCFLVSDYTYRGYFFDVNEWHIFEMLFGFVPILIAGFILTAGSHWSGNPMLKGWPILYLSLIWIAERIILSFNLLDPFTTLVFLQVYGISFIYLLHITIRGSKKNHLPFILFFIFLFGAKFIFSYGNFISSEDLIDAGKTMSIGLYRLIIIWIAGRVIPFFIKKRFPEIKISIPLFIHFSAYISLLIIIPFEVLQLPEYIISATAIISFLLHSYKLYLFHPIKTIKEPMIWVLNLAYLFICIHLLFLGLSPYVIDLTNGHGTLHLFTTGGLGLMAIGVMTRVGLGHTGRPIKANKTITAMFLLTALGAMLRVFLPILIPDFYYDTLHFSMGIWTIGFVIYLLKFTPILLRARV